jgi:pyruvate formate lyase activating enzyme
LPIASPRPTLAIEAACPIAVGTPTGNLPRTDREMSTELRGPRPNPAPEPKPSTLKGALETRAVPGHLYDPMPERPGWLQCYACGHLCRIPPGRDGICRVRFNRDGVLYVPAGYVGALQCDPIEKKPFFHALPGSDALSFGMLGCDYHCSYCFTGDTRVITDRGIVRIDSLPPEEGISLPGGGQAGKADSRQALTHTGALSTIQQVFAHPHDGPVVEVTPFYFPAFRCTPEHRVLATTDRDSTPEWIPAGRLSPRHFLSIPKPRVTAALPVVLDAQVLLSGISATYRVPRSLPQETSDWIVSATRAGMTSRQIGTSLDKDPSYIRHVVSRFRRGLWRYERQGGLLEEGSRVRFFKERRPGIPRWIAFDQELAELLGWYCAEGCIVSSRKRPNTHGIALAFGPHETDQAERARELLERVFGLRATVTRRPTSIGVALQKTSAALLIRSLCGHRAATKRIPSQLLTANPEIREAFLAALVAGDGHRYRNGKISITTISEDLAYGIAYLVLLSHRLPAVYAHARPGLKRIEGRIVRQAGKQFTVVWYDSEVKRKAISKPEHFLVPVKRVEAKPYQGPVFNLEVAGEHTYTANFFAVHNCQNWITSQALRDPSAQSPLQPIGPEGLVQLAERAGAPVIASTYNEPLITSEWAVEVFRHAKAHGLLTAYISNGNATPRVLDYLRPWVDLYKVDLKGFDDRRYHDLGGVLRTVLETIGNLKSRGFWVEVVTLIIPGFNDSDAELTGIARFLAGVDRSIPWHVTAFHPDYKMRDCPETGVDTLLRAAAIGHAAGLQFVYAGNLPGRVGDLEHTRCPGCRALLIERRGYLVLRNRLLAGRCPDCSALIPGVWSRPAPAAGSA